MPQLEKIDDVYLLRFSQPDDPAQAPDNVFSLEFLDELEACIDELAAVTGPAALVTTGAGKFYSNGLDVEYAWGTEGALNPYIERVHEVFARVIELPMTTIAAINGHAFGAGAMLTLCHDVRLMRDDRGFWCLPEVARSMPFPPGMNALVKNTLPPQTSRLAMFTSHRFGAQDAQAAGIVDGISTEATLVDDCVQRAALATAVAGENIKGVRTTWFADTLTALRTPMT